MANKLGRFVILIEKLHFKKSNYGISKSRVLVMSHDILYICYISYCTIPVKKEP